MTRRTTLATSAALATACTLASALSACATSHHATATSPATATAPSSAPAASAPTATGHSLHAVLPTAADLAAGITVSNPFDTGTAWIAPDELAAPSLPGADCTAAPAIDADSLTSDYRAAYASEELDNASNSLQLVVAATNPGDAVKQLAEVRSFAARCRSFTAPDSTRAEVGGTIELDTFAGLGDEAIRIRVTATGPNAANYAQPEVVLVRVGDQIAAVSDADPSHDQAAAVSAATLLAAHLTGGPPASPAGGMEPQL